MTPILKFMIVMVALAVGIAVFGTITSSLLSDDRLALAAYLVVAIALLWRVRCPSCRTPVLFGWKWLQSKPSSKCAKCGYDLGKRPTATATGV
jgi:hypothetical protein